MAEHLKKATLAHDLFYNATLDYVPTSCFSNMSHHHGHDHDHDHGDHGHNHGGHEHSDETAPALQTLIWKQIDFDNIRTLNESETDAGARIIRKTWPERLHPEPELVSDADEQLLMFVP